MSDDWTQRLGEHLEREIAAVDAAALVLEQDCERLVAADMEAYAAAQAQRDQSGRLLEVLRAERERILAAIGAECGLDETVGISALLERCDAERRDALSQRRDRLREGLLLVQRLHERHAHLVHNGLAFVDDIVRRVFRAESARSYTRLGRRDRLQPRDGSLFSASA